MIRAILGAAVLTMLSCVSMAQTNPLVGTWERVSALNAAGEPDTTNQPGLLMVSEEGYFIYTAIPSNRPKVNKPLDQLTREELLDRFRGVSVRRGTWTMSGNRWSNIELGTENPNIEGREVVRIWKIEHNELVLSSPDVKNKTENRWKRVKPVS